MSSSSSLQRLVFTFGCGHDGRLGHGASDKEQNSPVPRLLSTLHEAHPQQRVVAVRCGGYHTFIICEDAVFAFGLGEQGQLGTGDFKSSKHKPTQVDLFQKKGMRELVDIQCGRYHTVAWMKDGIYVCGGNTQGQLGLGDFDDRKVFTRVELLSGETGQHIVGVSAGSFHTVVLVSPENSRTVLPTEEQNQRQQPEDPFYHRLAAAKEIARQQSFNLVVACGKGDFGELGYDADAWDLLAAKERKVKAEVGARSRHQMMGGENTDFSTSLEGYSGANTDGTNSNNSNHVPMKPKVEFNNKKKAKGGVPQRRKEFSSATFKPVRLPRKFFNNETGAAGEETEEQQAETAQHLLCLQEGDESGSSDGRTFTAPDGMLIVNIKAMHHKTVIETANGQLYEFGCHYCGKIEEKDSSIARPIQCTLSSPQPPAMAVVAAVGDNNDTNDDKGKNNNTITTPSSLLRVIDVIAADEICLALCEIEETAAAEEEGKEKAISTKARQQQRQRVVMVKGKGNLGMGDASDWEEEWVPHTKLQVAASVSPSVASPSSSFDKIVGSSEHFFVVSSDRKTVFCFGDNFMGQLGIGHDNEAEDVHVFCALGPDAISFPSSAALSALLPRTNEKLRHVLTTDGTGETVAPSKEAEQEEKSGRKVEEEEKEKSRCVDYWIEDVAVGVRHSVVVVAYKH